MTPESYVESIVRPILSSPESFTVNSRSDAMGVLVTIGVAKEDMPRVIGKNGITMNAIRLLVRQNGALNNARVSLKLEEPPGSEWPTRAPLLNK